MRGNELLDKMKLIDPAYVEEADSLPKKKNYAWLRWCAMAACICLIIVGVVLQREPTDGISTNLVGHTIAINGDPSAQYSPISFDERLYYGLVPADAIGLDESNIYQISEADLGDPMGVVTACNKESLVGCNVYHFEKYPDTDSICIVDTPHGYEFYVIGEFTFE